MRTWSLANIWVSTWDLLENEDMQLEAHVKAITTIQDITVHKQITTIQENGIFDSFYVYRLKEIV